MLTFEKSNARARGGMFTCKQAGLVRGKPSKKIKWDFQEKKIQRQMLSVAKLIGANPNKNRLRLKNENAAKREWRLRKKLSIQTGKYFINV